MEFVCHYDEREYIHLVDGRPQDITEKARGFRAHDGSGYVIDSHVEQLGSAVTQ